jgi:6-phosphogluconolactonase
MDVQIFTDPQSLAAGAAEHIVALAEGTIRANGRFSLALSGGSTPQALYELLATPAYAGRIKWERTHIFWGDERCVPPDHIDSCYRMARLALLDHVPLQPGHIHRIKGESPPSQGALEYEHELREFFGDQPRLDLILLGMGDDGHTASLFPGTKALHEEKRWVIENDVPAKRMWRITLTRSAINAAANVLFLVSGRNKAECLREVLEGEYRPYALPAQLIQPTDGVLSWFVDQDAAQLLV